jgi:hypothetical protein
VSRNRQFIEHADAFGKLLVEMLNDPVLPIFQDLDRGQIEYEQRELWPFFYAHLIREGNQLLDRGLICSERAIAGAVVFTRCEEILCTGLQPQAGCVGIRQCACGCGRWFLARPQQKRYYKAACRTKLWELKMTKEQKKQHLLRRKRLMSTYYNKHFRAKSLHA